MWTAVHHSSAQEAKFDGTGETCGQLCGCVVVVANVVVIVGANMIMISVNTVNAYVQHHSLPMHGHS